MYAELESLLTLRCGHETSTVVEINDLMSNYSNTQSIQMPERHNSTWFFPLSLLEQQVTRSTYNSLNFCIEALLFAALACFARLSVQSTAPPFVLIVFTS